MGGRLASDVAMVSACLKPLPPSNECVGSWGGEAPWGAWRLPLSRGSCPGSPRDQLGRETCPLTSEGLGGDSACGWTGG